jgi:hypothetical protein
LNVVLAGVPVHAELLNCIRVNFQAVDVETGSEGSTVYVLSALAKAESDVHAKEGLRTLPAPSVTTNV